MKIGGGKSLVLMAVLLLAGAALLFLPVREWFGVMEGWIVRLGPLGPAIFILLYVAAAVLLIPGSAMTVGAGTIFGLGRGLAYVVVGANLGALSAFLLARTLLGERVRRWSAGNPRFEALDRAIGREGFRMVLLARLSPVFPFTLLNYLLGLTRIRVGAYVIANLIGMLPGTLLYTYIGATAREALGGVGGAGKYRMVLRLAGLLATVAVVMLMTRSARRAMAEIEAEAGNGDAREGR